MGRLEAMRVFASIVESGGFSAASRALGIPLPTVSRQIAELEKQLGAQLLTRSTRKVAVTESGRQYYNSVCRILESIADAEAEVAGEYRSPRGRLTITAPALFGTLHVLPVVLEFMKTHENIIARLLFSNFIADLVDESIDIGIRIGKVVDTSLIASSIGEVRHLYCASPNYLSTRGWPQRPENLKEHDCISFSKFGDPAPWPFRTAGQVQSNLAFTPRLVVDSAEAAIAAAIAGSGVTWLYSYQAAPHIADGSLSRVLVDFEPAPAPVNIVHPSTRLEPQKVRSFIEFSRERLRSSLHKANCICNLSSS